MQSTTKRTWIGVVAWTLFVQASALTPVARAHGEYLAEALAGAAALFVWLFTALFIGFVPGQRWDKLRVLAALAVVEIVGIALIAHGDGIASTIGGWIYFTGLLIGPIAGAIWVNARHKHVPARDDSPASAPPSCQDRD